MDRQAQFQLYERLTRRLEKLARRATRGRFDSDTVSNLAAEALAHALVLTNNRIDLITDDILLASLRESMPDAIRGLRREGDYRTRDDDESVSAIDTLRAPESDSPDAGLFRSRKEAPEQYGWTRGLRSADPAVRLATTLALIHVGEVSEQNGFFVPVFSLPGQPPYLTKIVFHPKDRQVKISAANRDLMIHHPMTPGGACPTCAALAKFVQAPGLTPSAVGALVESRALRRAVPLSVMSRR